MREFQEYTKDRRPARRRRRWLWCLPAGLLAALVVVGIGMRTGGLPTPMQALGQDAGGPGQASRGHQDVEPVSWVQRMLGGADDEPVVEGPLNVLVLGVDENPGTGDDGDGEVAKSGIRTDTIMLVQIVPETGEVKLLSVPRDLFVEIEPGVEDKVNAAYAYGGIEQTMTALEGYTGVPIEHYATIDFQGFEEVIQAMDGVTVNVEGEDFPEKWHMGDGLERLGGRKALFYARYRGTEGGDLDRIRRQQEMVAALRSKALRWDTATKLPKIMKVMNENVETDLGLGTAVVIGRTLVKEGRDARMTSVRLDGTPKTLPDGNEVLVPDDESNEAKLDEFRY